MAQDQVPDKSIPGRMAEDNVDDTDISGGDSPSLSLSLSLSHLLGDVDGSGK